MKRSVKLLLLVALLAVLGACYALAGRVGGGQEVSETEGSYPLSDMTADDMTALSWTYGDASWRFEKNGSVWVNAEDASFPVNQSALGAMASRIAGLTATRELTDVQDRADYGLDAPVLTVTAEGPNGSATYTLGDETPFADGYYVGVSGRDAVYTVETSLESAFDKDASQLAQMETLPEADDVTRITVGEALDATLGGDGVWRDTASGEALDGDAVASLVDDASGVSWSALVAVSADDAALADYGLDGAATRVTLYSGEEEARTLLIGNENDAGDRFARLPDSGMVYTLYGGDVSALLSASAATLFDPKVMPLALEDMAEAVFAYDGGETAVVRTAGAQTEDASEEAASGEEPSADAQAQEGDSSEEETADGAALGAFTVNGAQAQAQSVADLWALWTELTATERVEETPQGDAVLRAALTDAQGNRTEIALYPRDVDSYLMPVSGTHALLVPADGVDRIVRALRQLAGA